MPAATAQALVLAYAAWPVVASDMVLVEATVQKSIEFRFSIWDAMVIEAATRVQVETLYSEDFSYGQRFGAVEVAAGHSSIILSARKRIPCGTVRPRVRTVFMLSTK
jgi:hypothetical protein